MCSMYEKREERREGLAKAWQREPGAHSRRRLLQLDICLEEASVAKRRIS